MSRSLFSTSWHSVAELRPQLSPLARVHRHVYRKQIWYVLQDQAGGRYHRLSPSAYALVGRMDGQHSVQSLWQVANQASASDALTQNEIVDLLVQLHATGLLQTDVTPDSAALFDKHKKKKSETFKQWLLNPMSLKLPLVNPDPWLARLAPYFSWSMGRRGALLWLAVVLPALMLAIEHWGELTLNLSDRVLSSSNLLVMAVVFPVVKLLHELGHGVAAKLRGGAVPQLGLMFMVFAPVPYVEASSSSAFASKYQRMWVAAAGMLVELFVAALAMYVWLLVEPGIVRAIAYNVMVIAGVSTLIVNGNPLLRYDGYFILADLIEMPNLAQRGQKYLGYLWDRHVFGATDLAAPHETLAERRWLWFYTPLAWCYRTFVSISIILFVGSQFFIFGILLAIWSTISLVCLPLWKACKHVASSPSLHHHRQRAVRVTLGLVVCMLIVGFVMPMPLRTQSEGVIWLPERAILRAGEDGFFQKWLAAPGTQVGQGQVLYWLEDRLLESELEVGRAKVAEAEARFLADQFAEPVKAALTQRQLEQERDMLHHVEARAGKLIGMAGSAGTLVVQAPQDMLGRHYRKGELMGYVLRSDQLLVRAVVSQDDIDLVRSRTRAVDLRLTEAMQQTVAGRIVQVMPGGVDELPSAALSIGGGGIVPTSPDDPNGVKAMQRIFLVDIRLPAGMLPSAFGERVHVRFNLGYEPLALQASRRLRQLFLSHFNV